MCAALTSIPKRRKVKPNQRTPVALTLGPVLPLPAPVLILNFCQINALDRKRVRPSTICRHMLDSPCLSAMLARIALRRQSNSAIQIKLGFFIREYVVVEIDDLFSLRHTSSSSLPLLRSLSALRDNSDWAVFHQRPASTNFS